MSILDNAKEVAELVRKYNDLDLYEKIIDLRDEIFALREENLTLKQQIADTQAAQDISLTLVREGNMYYRVAGEKRTGPYCLACWDGDKKLVNVMLLMHGRMKCGRCDKEKGA
jgi:hypothetical protein